MTAMLQTLTYLTTHKIPGAILVAAALLAPFNNAWRTAMDYDAVLGSAAEAQANRNTSAAARLIGEVRTSMSDLMFMKAERYLNQGVAYNESALEDSESGGALETLILDPLNDWRGFIGDLEREVKPWMDPKLGRIAKARSEEVMPWFRLMTLVNPHRVRGYRVGTGMIMMEGTPEALDRAWEFADEGIRNNPESHEMRYLKMRILVWKAKMEDFAGNEEETTRLLEMALQAARETIETGVESRPPGGWKPQHELDKSADEKEEALAAGMYQEVQILQRLGRTRLALEKANEHLAYFGGNDPVLANDVRTLTEAIENQGPS
jgi:hypothetical protein